MMTTLRIVPYERQYHNHVLNLLHYSQWSHTHLDWYQADEWLLRDDGIIWLAWQESTLVGVMGISTPLNDSCWIRLCGVRENQSPLHILQAIWDTIREKLQAFDVQLVSVLVVSMWLSRYLPNLGFRYMEDVVTLHRIGDQLPLSTDGVDEIVSAESADLRRIQRIDHAAFRPQWQMADHELWQAFRQSALATMYKKKGEIVGYQMSTRHRHNAHLARLAVIPEMQGKRIGGTLLHDLISRLLKQGIRTITVNTQHSNVASQRLYQRFGFFRNGFDLPVWITRI